jgi:hypothetical protein
MKHTSYLKAALVVLLSTVFVPAPGVADEAIGTHSGPEQRIIGPSRDVDSVYATVRDGRGVHAYMSNDRTIWYNQRPDGTLTRPRTILTAGPKGSPDQCGVHPVGGVYKVTSTHWVTFFHAERANPHEYRGECQAGPGKRNHTRWSVLRLQTFNAGKTWRKGEPVLRQDQAFTSWSTEDPSANQDDAGSPRLVMQGDYLYLFYRAVNQDSPLNQKMSVARAPKSSLGKGGSWQKFYHGSYSQPGLGGHQSAILGLPATARGISWNTYLNSYISVEALVTGITLYVSEGDDLTRWHPLKKVVGAYGTESAWGRPCIPGRTPDFPVAIGYGATIGWTGSSTTTGRNFWVYYMKKPKGNCFSARYLVRRQIALDGELRAYPTPRVWSGAPR